MPTTRFCNPVIAPTSGGLGAEIRGVDLRRLDEDAFSVIRRAWLDNLVLLFRDQDLTDTDLIAFSRRFGELDLAPIQETGRRFVEGMPEIYIVSNVLKDGEPIGSLGSGEAVWHTDMSYVAEPPMASMLYALEVPPTGGNTEFVNMYSVYEALPAELQRRIAGLRVKHDGTYNSGGYVRQGVHPDGRSRANHRVPCIHWCALTRRRGGECSIWGDVAMPISRASICQIPTRCWMSYGPILTVRSSSGTLFGKPAISFSGTIAAPCIVVIRSMRLQGASCTEPRLRDKRGLPRELD